MAINELTSLALVAFIIIEVKIAKWTNDVLLVAHSRCSRRLINLGIAALSLKSSESSKARGDVRRDHGPGGTSLRLKGSPQDP